MATEQEQAQQTKPLPDFGKPIKLATLLAIAETSSRDLPSASAWFDEHASEEWRGALSNKPIGAKKKR